MDQDVEKLEKAIKEKIDALFDREVSESRFVRSSSGSADENPVETGAKDLIAQLKPFHERVSKERQELKELLDQVPDPDELSERNTDSRGGEILEMARVIKDIGEKVGPVLDRLAGLTRQMLEDVRNS